MTVNPNNSKVAANTVRNVTRLSTGGRNSVSKAENRGFTRACWYVLLALIAVTWAVYGQTLRHDFVNFDDDLYVYDNPLITRGLSVDGISRAFTQGHARNWHPLTTITHMVDCQVYGLRAGGHHLTNVLLHTIGAVLLFVALQQMTGAVWRSAFVAVLFAIHPLHVESVAWVAERKDVLSAVFFMLTLLAFVHYTRAPSIWRYLVVASLFAFALMSKPMVVTLPFLLLFLDYWPLRRFEGPHSSKEQVAGLPWRSGMRSTPALVAEKVPLLVLSAGSCAVTFMLQKRATGAIPPLPFSWRIQNAFTSYVIYVYKTIWPARLAVFYPHPNDTLPTWEVIFAATVLLAISATVIVLRRARPYLFTGWFWYLCMLIPVIGLVQVGEQGYADRYMYLPSIGLFLIAVWFGADALTIWKYGSRVAVAVAVIVVFAMTWTACIQASYWRNSETLWNHALAVTIDNDFAHNNLGYLCVDHGELERAISHFEEAAQIRSGKPDPHYSVGSAFVEMNLADALSRKGQSDQAMVHYEQALKLQPNYADAYYNRGNVLLTQGRIAEAIADLETAIQIQPEHADAHTCLGNALLREGAVGEAIAHYDKALALAPQDPHSRNNLAWLLATSSEGSVRSGARAVELAQQAVQLSGGRDPHFRRTLAAAYAESGQFSQAVSAAQQAMAIANLQGESRLATTLRRDIALYREQLPLRELQGGN
jgi:tetratricopeptide (TPR) repeat protein